MRRPYYSLYSKAAQEARGGDCFATVTMTFLQLATSNFNRGGYNLGQSKRGA